VAPTMQRTGHGGAPMPPLLVWLALALAVGGFGAERLWAWLRRRSLTGTEPTGSTG
jgi:hypothetical protein